MTDEKKTNVTEDPKARAEACSEEIQKVLKKFNCYVLPYIKTPEAVGTDGSKCLIQASFGIMPAEQK